MHSHSLRRRVTSTGVLAAAITVALAQVTVAQTPDAGSVDDPADVIDPADVDDDADVTDMLAAVGDSDIDDVMLDTVWGDDPVTGKSFVEHTVVGSDGTQMRVAPEQVDELADAGLEVTADLKAAPDAEAAVSGSQSWVTILCAFPDDPDRPRDLGYFESMFGTAAPRLDDYWREVSYGAIDVQGSDAAGWKTLPRPRSAYVGGSGGRADLDLLFEDCTRLHDRDVDFTPGGQPYAGINMAFNGPLDCCAWGGSQFATLDGARQQWRTTWLPPFGYQNQDVFAHEMGHGFGLPHGDNTDGDRDTYDSPWDVMSKGGGNRDARFGTVAVHPVAAHKIQLGWYDDADVVTVAPGRRVDATINPATTAAGRHVIEIDDGGSRFLVEVRELAGPYDSGLPGPGPGDRKAIISEVVGNTSRVLDTDVPPADRTDTEGSQWRPGETFAGPGFRIEFGALTSTGMNITVDRTDPSA